MHLHVEARGGHHGSVSIVIQISFRDTVFHFAGKLSLPSNLGLKGMHSHDGPLYRC